LSSNQGLKYLDNTGRKALGFKLLQQLLVLSFFYGKFFKHPVGSGKGFFLQSSVPVRT